MALKTKVLLADDHPVFLKGLRTLLSAQTDLQIVGEAETAEIAVSLARNCRPDVVLMGLAMPIGSREWATRRILRLLPKCKVLAWSIYTDELSVKQMLDAGAVGYLTKDSQLEELIQAIHGITAGRQYFFSPDVATTAQRINKACRNESWKDPLTSCEKEVLKLLVTGLTNKVVATQLKLTLGKVNYYRERLMAEAAWRCGIDPICDCQRIIGVGRELFAARRKWDKP